MPAEANSHQPEFFIDTFTYQALIGRTALDAHIEAGGNPGDVVSLGEFLHSEHVIPKDFRVRIGPSTKEPTDIISATIGIDGILRQANNSYAIKEDILIQAGHLGLAHPFSQARSIFTDTSRIYTEAGLTNFSQRAAYRDWDEERLADYLEDVIENGIESSIAKEMKRRALLHEGPTIDVIQLRGIDITSLGEKRHYVLYPSRWPGPKFIEWGVRFMHANGGRAPLSKDLEYLSAAKRGPSKTPIVKNFGTFTDYKERLEKEFALDVDVLSRRIKQIFIRAGKPSGVVSILKRSDMPLPLKLKATAQYIVLDVLARDLNSVRKQHIATHSAPKGFTDAAHGLYVYMTEDRLKATAHNLGIYSEIWEMDLSYLQVLRPKTDEQ